MDLSQLDTVTASEEGFVVEIFHPVTNASTGIFIEVLGRDSDAYEHVLSRQMRKRGERMTRGNQFKPKLATQEEMRDDTIEILAAVTRKWWTLTASATPGEDSTRDDALTFETKRYECNRENAAFIYRRLPVIREQVDTAVNDRANLLKGSSTD